MPSLRPRNAVPSRGVWLMPRDYLGTALQANGSQVLTKATPFSIGGVIVDPTGARDLHGLASPVRLYGHQRPGPPQGWDGGDRQREEEPGERHLASDLSVTIAQIRGWMEDRCRTHRYAIRDELGVEVASRSPGRDRVGRTSSSSSRA